MKRRIHANRSAASGAPPRLPAGNREFVSIYPPPPATQTVLDQIKGIGEALEQSGAPVIRYRKVNGILNALAMQVEDGGDNPVVVAHLLDALEAAVRAIISEPAATAVLPAVHVLRVVEAQRRS